jgi:pantetheine-phosphate adenylyltransferase
MSTIALYAGTFDPITNGHLDIIKRSCKLFKKVIIAVASNEEKKPMFSLKKRIKMIKKTLKSFNNIEVIGFNNLTVDLAKEYNASVLIRGLRAVSDFEYELQLGYLNNSLNDTIETIYLMPTLKNAFVSSSAIRSLIKYNGKTSHLVPKKVEKMIRKIQ